MKYFTIIICMLFSGCVEPVPNDLKCVSNIHCHGGDTNWHRPLCSEEGICTAGELLGFASTSLEKAVTGGSYSFKVQVEGGLDPFSWEMNASASGNPVSWLEIGPETGEITTDLVPEMAEGFNKIDIEIIVRDSSEVGEGDVATKRFILEVKECDENQSGYKDREGVCYNGTTVCVNGALSDWVEGGKSDNTEACGEACQACDLDKASKCDGACKCGVSDACIGSTGCCENGGANFSCVALDSVEHCGSCGNSCESVIHTVEAQCTSGDCGYKKCPVGGSGEGISCGCDDGYIDCNSNTRDGCESRNSNPESCGLCEIDCNSYQNTEGNADCLEDGNSDNGFSCQLDCLNGFASCDGEFTTGCESDITLPARCGDCSTDCEGQEVGTACVLDGDTNSFVCGCENTGDCQTGYLCCDSECIPQSDDECSSCGVGCGIGDTCCPGDGSGSCANLLEEKNNCGLCGAECIGEDSCQNGVCSCQKSEECPGDEENPVDSNTSVCFPDTDMCVCAAYIPYPNLRACPVGQYCCGNNGCCLDSCDGGDSEECSADCIQNGGTWGEDGCN